MSVWSGQSQMKTTSEVTSQEAWRQSRRSWQAQEREGCGNWPLHLDKVVAPDTQFSGSSDEPSPFVNIESHQTFVSHFQEEGLANFLVHDIGAFHDLVDFERLLAERAEDIFSIIQHALVHAAEARTATTDAAPSCF